MAIFNSNMLNSNTTGSGNMGYCLWTSVYAPGNSNLKFSTLFATFNITGTNRSTASLRGSSTNFSISPTTQTWASGSQNLTQIITVTARMAYMVQLVSGGNIWSQTTSANASLTTNVWGGNGTVSVNRTANWTGSGAIQFTYATGGAASQLNVNLTGN